MKRIGLFALNLVVTLVGGWVLAHIVVGLSAEMPAPLEDALRVLLRITGHEEFANEEDLPALGMMAVLIASIVVVGGVVWVAKLIVGVSEFPCSRRVEHHTDGRAKRSS
ncbi:hypothetical protein [Burkholderia gladioli]|uniref:hypothetical protein n=1 Tax=Burkholderia gladioli TaxID=28095 RepID=UPI001FC83254|nr:hypothetical protein [Burkholderia gladioli]